MQFKDEKNSIYIKGTNLITPGFKKTTTTCAVEKLDSEVFRHFLIVAQLRLV